MPGASGHGANGNSGPEVYLGLMPVRNPLEIPLKVARRFAADMRVYHAAKDAVRRDEIAAGTRHMLLDHMPKATKLRLSEVEALFEQMRS
jgi:hypothetical protein